MQPDRPDIREKLARASLSGDLKSRDAPCDLDKVAAAGLAGIGESLGVMLFRLKYANESRLYQEVRTHLILFAQAESKRRRWNEKAMNVGRLVKTVLDVWLIEACIACEGRGYSVLLGAPVLSDQPCPACGGRGRMALDRPVLNHGNVPAGHRWDDRARWLLGAIHAAESRAGEEAIRKLAREVREL